MYRASNPHTISWFIVCLAPLLLGCGDPGPQRAPVQGTVTLKGKPLAEGQIRFFPLGEGIGTDGVIKDGKYAIAAERGLTAGKYRVEVSAEVPTGRKVPDYDAGPGDVKDEVVERVPKEYNSESKLQIDFDPESDKPHDFDLK